jgi:hypothetical protein
MHHFSLSLGLFSLFVFSIASVAGDPPPQRDDAAILKIVADGNEAVQKGDWQKYADLMDPQSLEDYKKMWQPVLTAAAKKGHDEQAELLTVFDKAVDLKSLLAMKPKEFFVSSMKGMSAQFKQNVGSSPFGNQKIIGVVHDGNDQAYVVVRATQKFNGAELTKMDVVGLKRNGAEWRLELPDVVRTMAEGLSRIAPAVDRATVPDAPKK